jgi:cysteine desulfurase family protein (TIGR01976 family)
MTPATPSAAGGQAATFDVEAVRAHFPALSRVVDGEHPIYLDNPGGTQVPTSVIEAISDMLVNANANVGAAYETSRRADQIVMEAREAMADFLNAPSPDNIVFGANMTSLTMALSRAVGKSLSEGDEIVVTHLDHDGNISPWLLIADDHKLKVKWVDINKEDCTLDMAQLESQITDRTRVVAAGYASNASGTVNDVKKIVELAHQVGALAYVDAVHYTPHGPIDVQDLDCDFLVCSPYKFFGPHAGVLYGKRKPLSDLPAYKVRPAPTEPPDRWETGTQNHEAIAGITATVNYLAWVGEQFGRPYAERFPGFAGRRLQLKTGMAAIEDYERTLSQHMLEGLAKIEGVKVFGITDVERLDERVPTFVLRVDNLAPRRVAEALDKAHIYVWDGDYYAVEMMDQLGYLDQGGMVRVGAVHYNTLGEVDRFLNELTHIASAMSRIAGKGVDPTAETDPGTGTKPVRTIKTDQ